MKKENCFIYRVTLFLGEKAVVHTAFPTLNGAKRFVKNRKDLYTRLVIEEINIMSNEQTTHTVLIINDGNEVIL